MECEWTQCLCLCVTFWSFHDFTLLCVFMWSAGHRAQRVSSGLHSLPGCFCVPVAVRVRDSAAQADAYTERIMADAENAAFSTETAGTYRWDGNCWFKLLSFSLRCPFFSSSLILYSHISLCLCLEKDWLLGKNIAGREAWWGKPGGVLTGIARCKWFHLSHVSLKILFWVVVLSYCWCMFAFCALAKWKCCFVRFPFLKEWGRFKTEFSFWSCYSSSGRAVIKGFFCSYLIFISMSGNNSAAHFQGTAWSFAITTK